MNNQQDAADGDDGDNGEVPLRPAGLGALDVDLPGEHIVGFPLLIGLTVQADAPNAGLRRLPLAMLSRLSGSVGLQLLDPSGVQMAATRPHPVDAPDLGLPIYNLLPGESRRMLVEVGEVLPFSTLKEGTYHLRVTYASTRSSTTSEPLPIQIRFPTPYEKAVLQSLWASRGSLPSWGDWALAPAPDRTKTGEGFMVGDPSVYLRALRHLRESDEDLASINPALLDVVTGPPAKEALLLKAELAFARGDKASFQAIQTHVEQQLPGLLWWITKMVEGRSDFAFARANRPKPKP
ncbi:MAG: hypothetical protein IPK82_39395 [Polyangiaceae bacterium]|nr:hypothetical protein [Polyangiaceae bacterium]